MPYQFAEEYTPKIHRWPSPYILLAKDFPKYLEEFSERVMFVDDAALIVANKE